MPKVRRAEVDLEGFYALANAALGETPAAIHWDFVLATLQEASGLPQMVGLEVDPDVVPPPPPTAPVTAPAEPRQPRTAPAASPRLPAPAPRQPLTGDAEPPRTAARALTTGQQRGDFRAHFGDARGDRRRGSLLGVVENGASDLPSWRSASRLDDAGACHARRPGAHS